MPKTMGCQIHSLNPQLVYKREPISTKSIHLSPYFSIQPNLKFHKTTLLSPYNNHLHEQQTVSTITVNETDKIPKFDAYNVKFKTLGACELGISRYPDFQYNAEGGAGSGKGTKILDNERFNGEVSVDFDVKKLYVPPLSTATTKFLGLPFPPFLKIDIVPEVFNGKINQESGKVDLKFTAKFYFSVGSIYKAPPLLVDTILTSEESKGKIKKGRGKRLNKDGMCRLVGVATVERINDFFMDSFLNLPTECLANLNATISFISTDA